MTTSRTYFVADILCPAFVAAWISFVLPSGYWFDDVSRCRGLFQFFCRGL